MLPENFNLKYAEGFESFGFADIGRVNVMLAERQAGKEEVCRKT